MKLRMDGGEEEEASECSSGCQSGWTMYLDQSYENHPTSLPFKKGGTEQEEEEEDEEEEDLSMVSDASSGPPHFHEEDEQYHSHSNKCYNDGYGCFCSAPPVTAALAKNRGKRRRVEAKLQPTQQEPSSFLDDTASSPLFGLSKSKTCSFNATTTTNSILSVENVLEFSCGFSATHFKGKSAFQKHLGYLQSSPPVKPTSARPICREEGAKKAW